MLRYLVLLGFLLAATPVFASGFDGYILYQNAINGTPFLVNKETGETWRLVYDGKSDPYWVLVTFRMNNIQGSSPSGLLENMAKMDNLKKESGR